MKNAWIAPDGKIFECKEYGHLATAEEILKAQGVRTPTPETILEKEGFLKLSKGVFYFPFIRALSRKQAEFMENYAPLVTLNFREIPAHMIEEKFTC